MELKTFANTVYKLWLVLAYLENPADFPRASIGLECSVTNPRHSSYTKRWATLKKTNSLQKMKMTFFLILSVFVIFGCKSQNTAVEDSLRECINQRINEGIAEAYGKEPFDFYDFILTVEQELLKSGLLKNADKNNYFNLLKSIPPADKEYEKIFHLQNRIMDDFGFFPFSTETIFNQCPYKVSVDSKDGEGALIYNQAAILYKMMEKGYDDENLLTKLEDSIDEEDFKKAVYRAPIVLLVMIELDKHYNPDLKKLKEYQKGRTFLKRTDN